MKKSNLTPNPKPAAILTKQKPAVAQNNLALKQVLSNPKPASTLAVPKGKEEKKEVVEKVEIQPHRPKKRTKDYLLTHDPWLNALLDPFHVHGIKIPDMDTRKSVTFAIWAHFQIPVNAHNIATVCLGLYPYAFPSTPQGSMVPVGWTGTGAAPFCYGCTSSTSATTNNVLGDTVTSPTPLTFPFWGGAGPVLELFNQARLVSAAARMTFCGNLTNAQGTITAVSAPRQTYRTVAGQGNLSLAILQSHPSCKIVSIPQSYAAETIYLPTDLQDQIYTDLQLTYAVGETPPDSAMGNELYLVASGAVIGQSMQVDICFNFEGIPSINTMQLTDAETSKSDPISYSNTWNKVPDVEPANPVYDFSGKQSQNIIPKLEQLQDSHDDKILTEPHPAQEKTMFENIVDGIDGFIDRGAKLVGKVAPALAALL